MLLEFVLCVACRDGGVEDVLRVFFVLILLAFRWFSFLQCLCKCLWILIDGKDGNNSN